MYKRKLRKNYASFEEFEAYSDTYGLAARLGFDSAQEAWDANPMIQGSADPRDFKTTAQARLEKRLEQLMPNGIPRYIRCYDNGGKTFDRYTVAYIGRWQPRDEQQWNQFGDRLIPCVGMSNDPFHPQGFGQHGMCMLGKHLGKRISFEALPEDCQRLVINDYKDIWDLTGEPQP